MNCLEFRQRKLSDPRDSGDELLRHRNDCEQCQRFEAQLVKLDGGIRDAFEVRVPENLAPRILLKQSFEPGGDEPAAEAASPRRGTSWRWVGIAATFVVAAVLVTVVLRPAPATALEQQLAAHLGKEEMLASQHPRAVAPADIEEALARADIDASVPFGHLFGNVIHARPCIIDGKLVAHIIVRQGTTNVTILLTPFEVDARSRFTAHGWDGIVEPMRFGAVAVLAASGPGDGQLDQAMKALVATL